MEQLLYSPEEAADMLSLSRSTVYELMRSGEIASYNIGRSRRIPHDELERFVALLKTSPVYAIKR